MGDRQDAKNEKRLDRTAEHRPSFRNRAADDRSSAARDANASETSEEIQNVLLLRGAEEVVVVLDRVRLGAGAVVREDGRVQVLRAAVVQEEDALAKAPQRRGAELIAAGAALRDVVLQAGAHVMDLEIAEEVRRRIAEARREAGR